MADLHGKGSGCGGGKVTSKDRPEWRLDLKRADPTPLFLLNDVRHSLHSGKAIPWDEWARQYRRRVSYEYTGRAPKVFVDDPFTAEVRRLCGPRKRKGRGVPVSERRRAIMFTLWQDFKWTRQRIADVCDVDPSTVRRHLIDYAAITGESLRKGEPGPSRRKS